MTRETILRKALEMAQHNLCCYSANYLNTTPKKGYEKQFEENSKEAEIIETWLKEFPSTYRDVNRVFVGHIGGWSCQRNFEDRSYISNVDFYVATGAEPIYDDVRSFGIAFELGREWLGSEDGCGIYDSEKDDRKSREIVIEVNSINTIVAMKWKVDEGVK